MTTKKPVKRPASKLVQTALPLEQEAKPGDTRLPSRIAALAIGESESSSVRIQFDVTSKDELFTLSNNLKSTMSKAADRASKRCDSRFVTEIGQFFTRSGDIIVTAVVTRVE